MTDQPTPDVRGVKFIAGASPTVHQWMRDYLKVDPDDVAEVVVTLRVAEPAYADVKLFLRSGALAAMPAADTVELEPTEDQVGAAAWAIGQASDRHLPPDVLTRLARAALKAAAPGPEQRPL